MYPGATAGDLEYRVVDDLGPQIGEREARHGARHAPGCSLPGPHLVTRLRGHALDLEHAKASVDVATGMEPGERLLTGEAAFAERDGALVEPGLGWEDLAVDLSAPARGAREDPQALELLVGRFAFEPAVEHLDRR